jgi:outer membrane lipoprotein LolB
MRTSINKKTMTNCILMRVAVMVSFVVLLNGCSSQPKPISIESPDLTPKESASFNGPNSPSLNKNDRQVRIAPELLSADEHHDILMAIDHWQVQGKIGLRIPNNSGSMYFNWKQGGENWAIHLSGPLGQGATWIRGNAMGVSLQAGDKVPIYADSADQLMQSSLGWSLPIKSLHYWIRGFPDPATALDSIEKDESNNLSRLSQSGWDIVYARHQDIDGWTLPKKIIATNSDIRVTIIIKNWRLY